jgi:hypothetical protein
MGVGDEVVASAIRGYENHLTTGKRYVVVGRLGCINDENAPPYVVVVGDNGRLVYARHYRFSPA